MTTQADTHTAPMSPPRGVCTPQCAYCGRALESAGHGTGRRYCGSRCRAAAWRDQHLIRLPFSGRTPLARHHSYLAAEAAHATRGAKTAAYLAWLRAHGPASDHEAADALGWPLSSICSIRNGVSDQVRAVGRTISPYGRACTSWEVRR